MVGVYHQTGHNFKWNLDSFIEDEVGDGLIVSPVNTPSQNIQKLSKGITSASFLDPQLYLPHDSKGKLQTYDYFPESISPNWSSRDYEEIAAEASEKCFEFQERLGFKYRVIPSRYVKDLTQNTFKIAERALIEPFLIAWKTSSRAPLLLTTIIKRIQVVDDQQQNEILNWITSFSDLSGVYLIFESDHTSKQIKDSEYLAGCMRIIHFLRRAGLEVHVGYVNSEAILFAAVGASSVTVGAYENLRKFRLSRFESSESGGGSPNPRLYVPKLFQWIEQGYLGALGRLYSNWHNIQDFTSYQMAMFTPTFKWHFTKPELYKHYFKCAATQVGTLNNSSDPLSDLENQVGEGIGYYRDIQTSGVVLDGDSDGSHLTHWLTAINIFRYL